MSYTLSYSSIAIHQAPITSEFGGSSKYSVIDGEICAKTNQNREQRTKDLNVIVPDYNEREIFTDAKLINRTKPEVNDKPTAKYKLNKSKVRKRCFALSRLEKSKKFLAFYTITFPEGISDRFCYKFFNNWLTRCRRTGGLTTYLWVAERQKNSTIHFHMLTNDFMPINVVNGYMSKTLSNAKKKGHEKLLNVNAEKYNGIDVQKVGKKRKTLVSYLTKYITKNNIEFYRLPWHCSRNVSKLFTSQNFKDFDSDELLNKLPKDPEKYKRYTSDFCKVSAFKFIPAEKIFNDLDFVNELIYEMESSKK
jgi:hypothetical protein